MARIQYTSLIEEIVGKLAGSVFQDSYGGFQVRTRVSPANPQTTYQQLRRGEFAWITGSWRNLTAPQLASWVAAAGTLPEAFRLYVSCNINSALIFEPPILTFVNSALPPAMPLEIVTYDTVQLTIQASGALQIVPAGHSLLLQATYQKAPQKIFTNPSQYSPITSLPAATDLSAPIDFAAEWNARYGIFKVSQRLCISSALIKNSNGLRGSTEISCAINYPVTGDLLIDFNGDLITDNVGDFLTFP